MLTRFLHLILITTVSLFTVTSITACGGGGGGPTTNPQPQPEPEPEPQPEPDPQPEPEPEPEPDPEPGDDIPEGGSLLITGSPSNNFNIWRGDFDGPVGSAETVDAEHESFSQAVRVNVTNPAGEFFNGQVQYPTVSDVSSGDILLVRFYFRSVENMEETGAGFATVFLEGPEPDYTKYMSREISNTGEWQEFFIPVEMNGAEQAGELRLNFGFGAGERPQVFEIADVTLLNYGKSLTTDDLPATALTYGGREEDAPWRSEAEARIEQHRKGDFTITVTDDGAPIEGAEIEVNFTRHAYHFGSVIVGNILLGEASDSEQYRQTVLEMFNQSGPENDLKWAPWIGEWGSDYNQTTTLNALQWLQDNGLYTRGHVMVWPSKRNLPNLMQPYLPEDDPANADPAAKQVVLEHIDDIASSTASVVQEWDVLNEPYDNHYLMDAFGDEVMVDWFNRARTHLPTQKLYINDYSILSGGGRNAPHQNHYQETIQYLVDQGAAIDGIGLQGHFGSTPTALPRVYEIIERYHQAFPGLAIRATEFDINTQDEQLQADYTRDFLTVFFSHPATVGVQTWGFWEGAIWRENTAMFRQNWEAKPNALAWKELIYNQWWNDFSGDTNTEGQFSERGFYGEYSVTITYEGETKQTQITLSKDGADTFEIEL